MTVNGTELTKEKGGADMKKTATISAILAVVGFMAVYVALCYLVPGWRLKLHATGLGVLYGKSAAHGTAERRFCHGGGAGTGDAPVPGDAA